MFSFFKKKDQSKNYGTFSAYGMEDLYHFLTEKRINEKIKELKDKPTLGTSFEDFVSKESVKSPSGELHFFIMLLWYFPNELDLALYLYSKSKDFSELDYPKKTSLKSLWKDHLNLMNEMSKRDPEKKGQYALEKRPVYWVEYDMLYVEILKNLVFNFNLQKFSKLQFVGDHKRKGSKINTPEIEINFRANRKPKSGFFLTFKSDLLFSDIKIDLAEIKQDIYKFDTFFGSYKLELQKGTARFSEIDSFSNESISLINSTNFIAIIINVITEYIRSFDKISDRYDNEISKPPINYFFFEALKIKNLENDIKSKIEGKIISTNGLWGKLKNYN